MNENRQLKNKIVDQDFETDVKLRNMQNQVKKYEKYIKKVPKEILDEIERNPELIDKLSYERLVKLNQLYDEKITELERLSLNVDINKK